VWLGGLRALLLLLLAGGGKGGYDLRGSLTPTPGGWETGSDSWRFGCGQKKRPDSAAASESQLDAARLNQLPRCGRKEPTSNLLPGSLAREDSGVILFFSGVKSGVKKVGNIRGESKELEKLAR